MERARFAGGVHGNVFVHAHGLLPLSTSSKSAARSTTGFAHYRGQPQKD
jgi:hypothetical protein